MSSTPIVTTWLLGEVGVEPISAMLKKAGLTIAPSSYYAAKTTPPSARAIRDAELVEDIEVTHRAKPGCHGTRQIHAELNRQGAKVTCCTVERLMRAEGIDPSAMVLPCHTES